MISVIALSLICSTEKSKETEIKKLLQQNKMEKMKT